MRYRTAASVTLGAMLLAAVAARSARQAPAVDPRALREYAGAYQWSADEFVYLQPWTELGENQLVAFDESGELRALYAADRDRFVAGPGAAVRTPVQSTIAFDRDTSGRVASLTWQRDGHAPRTARRVDIERHEDVRFRSGGLQLAGTLIAPNTGGRHPALVLVHGSGPQDRESILPFARFLIRHGVAVLGYDKRGVGASGGDWNAASLEDLAADVVAAVEYLKTRGDIDGRRIGLLGVSQAGWIMPLAAVRVPDLAFLISVSGAAVPPAETALDHAEREMLGRGMKPPTVAQIVDLMKLQNEYARTGRGWDAYAAARATLAARLGAPPGSFPGEPNHPQWDVIRRLYFYDPAPTLRRLRVPTLALFGALDNNILADKNRAAWETALKAGGHPDYTLRILPAANHYQLEAKLGTNAEMASLQRFVPEYSTTIRAWLAARIPGFGARRG